MIALRQHAEKLSVVTMVQREAVEPPAG